MLALASSLCFGQVAPSEPTRQEIADAYRSKGGQGGSLIPGLRWERFRIKEVRGWSLKFKRLGEEQGVGLLTLRYQAVAKKSDRCAEYQITETLVLPPVNPQIPLHSSLTVEPDGIKHCR